MKLKWSWTIHHVNNQPNLCWITFPNPMWNLIWLIESHSRVFTPDLWSLIPKHIWLKLARQIVYHTVYQGSKFRSIHNSPLCWPKSLDGVSLWYFIPACINMALAIVTTIFMVHSASPSEWVWRNSINSQFVPKTNPYQQSKTIPDYIIPLEICHINKLKETNCQVKCLSKCSIPHWKYIRPCPYIHPCFQVISLTVINILHVIGWFTRRNQNWFIMALAGDCPQTPSPITLTIKRDSGPYQYHKTVKI